MKTLVTGATGFIGKHLVPRLLREGLDIRCLARLSSLRPDTFKKDVEWITGDLSDPASLQGACRNIDLVIHLAGIVKSNSIDNFFQINGTGTENLLSVLRDRTKIIFISSQAAVGPSVNLAPLPEHVQPNPVSAYGRSKLMAEQILLKSNKKIDYSIIRPAIVYGPEDRESLSIFRIAKYHLNPYVGLRRSYVNIVYIKDLIEFIILCIHNNRPGGGIFHVNDGKDTGYTQNVLIKKAAEYMDARIIPFFIPKSILKTITGLNSIISVIRGKSSMLNPDKYKELTAHGWLLSSQKAQKLLGYQPKYDIDSGFKMTIDWYRENEWL